ncbi:nucleotidyltransferase family protein [Roseinatronobacter bogoriensis]|nr:MULTISPECIES: nucleotidyltransferase family protein [Rhodobaca]
MSDRCAILLPAAGASRRMRGTDKLLQPVDGQPILRLVTQRALQATPYVGVALRPEHVERQQALSGLPVIILPVKDASEGLAASLRAGASWALAQNTEALMVALPDMPDITADDMRDLIAAQARQPNQPMRASTVDGQPGHPVILPSALFPEMKNLVGDMGARTLLGSHSTGLHPLPGLRAVLDLDTPEQWALWRKGQPRP